MANNGDAKGRIEEVHRLMVELHGIDQKKAADLIELGQLYDLHSILEDASMAGPERTKQFIAALKAAVA